jgi:hypothetical protein
VSSDASQPSASTNGTAQTQNLTSALFPSGSNSTQSWSTADDAGKDQVELSDKTFRQTNDITELPHPYVDHAGKSAMQVEYKKGTWGLKPEHRGGVSFYAPGPEDVDLTTAKEATFGYSVYFEEGFQFNMGGKLPGLCALIFAIIKCSFP